MTVIVVVAVAVDDDTQCWQRLWWLWLFW